MTSGAAEKIAFCSLAWMYSAPTESACCGCSSAAIAVERAGRQDVQRLLVEAARLMLRQVVRKVGRFHDQRVAVDERRERIGHAVPVGPVGADRDRHGHDRRIGKIVLHEGQHGADAMVLVEQA